MTGMGKGVVFSILLIVSLSNMGLECPEEEFDYSDPLYAPAQSSHMAEVPAGSFPMGSDYSDIFDAIDGTVDEGYFDERPERAVTLDIYFIDLTEVSNAQYRACVAAKACSDPLEYRSATREEYYLDPEFNDYPVINISHDQAAAYCQWAGKRLPTEAEWEKAARGTQEPNYPWGDAQPTCEQANFSKIQASYDVTGEYLFTETCQGDTAPVTDYSETKNPYGAINMAGNVAEWVSDWYLADYYQTNVYPENKINPQGPGRGGVRVFRGGSFADNPFHIRAAYRSYAHPESGMPFVGFRCAMSLAD